jgi:inner membrane protein
MKPFMDNLAHTLIGVGVARAGLSKKFGSGTTLTLAVASNLPDIDIAWAVWDPIDRFLLRRTHTHALVALPLLAAALAVLLRLRYRDRPWRVLFGLSCLGIALHLLFDLVNAYGVVLLWPFSGRRFELACVFIVDPVVWSLMGLPLIFARALTSEAARLRLWRGAVALLFVYAGACYAGHLRAAAVAREVAGAEPRMFPEPPGPWRFRAAVRDGPVWRVYLIRPASGAWELRDTVRTDADDPRVAAVRSTPAGRRLEAFMAAVWSVRPDGTIEVEDLRFRSLVVRRRSPLTVSFRPGDPTPRADQAKPSGRGP